MKCKISKEELVSYLFGEMDETRTNEMERHLKSCPSCRKEFQSLRQTTDLLKTWEDKEPNMNMVFVRENPAAWTERLTGLGAKNFIRGTAIALGAVMLCLSIMNFKLSRSAGEWQVSFSLVPLKSQEALPIEQLTSRQKAMQQETIYLLSQMIKESESRQQIQLQNSLTQFAKAVETQRTQDLRMVGQGLEGLQLSTEGRFERTQAVLTDLVRLAGYSEAPYYGINQ